jgi:large subunit ribosomal protein L21
MFAVIKTGGKQYRVAANDVITVASLPGEPGSAVTFDQVLMVTNDNGTQVGVPVLEGISVAGEVVEHTRGEKVIAFKKRRRQNSRRKRGHRQDYTVVRITEILAGGEKPKKAAAKKTTKAAAEAAAPAETAAE